MRERRTDIFAHYIKVNVSDWEVMIAAYDNHTQSTRLVPFATSFDDMGNLLSKCNAYEILIFCVRNTSHNLKEEKQYLTKTSCKF